MRSLTSIVVLLAFACVRVAAQESADSAHDAAVTIAPGAPAEPIDGMRLALVGGVTAGAFVYGHVLQTDMWWKGERSAFHFEWHRDWTYSLGADKLGHAWFPYAMTHTYDKLLRWARFDSTAAILTAASLALAYQSYVEVRDGFSAEWGFSWGDFAADALGASLPVAQHYLPPLRHVDLKMSFYPSEKFQAGSNRAIIDDYESSYHWLTLHVAEVVPDEWRDHWPAFIDLALGHSVKDLDGLGDGTHEVFVALDWNLDALPGDWWPWDLLRHALRHYHLPSPALRVYPGPVRFGIQF